MIDCVDEQRHVDRRSAVEFEHAVGVKPQPRPEEVFPAAGRLGRLERHPSVVLGERVDRIGSPGGHQLLASRRQEPDRLVGCVHGPLDGVAQHDSVLAPGRPGAEPVAAHGPPDRVVDRHETGGEFVERLGHPVDVTQPVPTPGVLVAVAALVVEVPAGQRGRLERDPVLKPDLAGEGQHVSVDVERVVVDLAGFRFDSGPLDRDPPGVAAERDELLQVVAKVGEQAGAIARARGSTVALPGRPVGGRSDALGRDRRGGDALQEHRRISGGRRRRCRRPRGRRHGSGRAPGRLRSRCGRRGVRRG